MCLCVSFFVCFCYCCVFFPYSTVTELLLHSNQCFQQTQDWPPALLNQLTPPKTNPRSQISTRADNLEEDDTNVAILLLFVPQEAATRRMVARGSTKNPGLRVVGNTGTMAGTERTAVGTDLAKTAAASRIPTGKARIVQLRGRQRRVAGRRRRVRRRVSRQRCRVHW